MTRMGYGPGEVTIDGRTFHVHVDGTVYLDGGRGVRKVTNPALLRNVLETYKERFEARQKEKRSRAEKIKALAAQARAAAQEEGEG